MKVIIMVLVGAALLVLTGCPIFRATGRGVTAVGEGTGHAVSDTGKAISRAADETEDDIRN